VEHLAACSRCRHDLAVLLRSGALTAPVAGQQAAAGPRLGWRRHGLRMGLALAAAAALVLVAITLWQRPKPPGLTGPEAALAQVEEDVRQDRSATALERVERLLAEDLTAPQRQRALALLEEAGHASARKELEAGHFEEVRRLGQYLTSQGAGSARLRNLELQAERAMPAELALASVGELLQYGYEMDGLAPRKGLPDLDDKTERIQRLWEQALQEHPTNALLRLNFGQFLLTLADAAAAREQFARALELGGVEAQARLGLGLIDFEDREPAKALEQFEAALKVSPSNLAAVVNAAICLEQLKRRDEARRYWLRARELAGAELRQRIDQHLRRPAR
jgi:tetratricopeptide (TPR) repeat protein